MSGERSRIRRMVNLRQDKAMMISYYLNMNNTVENGVVKKVLAEHLKIDPLSEESSLKVVMVALSMLDVSGDDRRWYSGVGFNTYVNAKYSNVPIMPFMDILKKIGTASLIMNDFENFLRSVQDEHLALNEDELRAVGSVVFSALNILSHPKEWPAYIDEQ